MKLLVLVTLVSTAVVANASIRLPALFADGMVLQQKTHAPIWGWADPGEKVSVKGGWGAEGTATAGKDGKWMAHLMTPVAGGPYDVTITGHNTITIHDVLLGEVWICSGQSNMELTLQQAKNAPTEIANANYPNIRMFTVIKAQSQAPKDDCVGKWEVCNSQNSPGFSAVGYFFARELNKQLGVPIGMIHTSWGGTESELWTSEKALRKMPEFATRIEGNAKAMEAYRLAMQDYDKKVEALDPGHDKWDKPGVDTSDWKHIDVPMAWSKGELANFDGAVWYRATFTASDSGAGKKAMLELGQVDDQDITYVNGVKVGATGDWQTQRNYTIPEGVIKAGENTVAVRVLDTGGEGGFMTPNGQHVKIGDDTLDLTGWAWKTAFSIQQMPPPPPPAFRVHSILYNAMIAPLIPYAIKGAIWYQGEANVGRAHQYREAFPAMIKNWRDDWGEGEFPFYFVQIAPFTGYQQAMSAELREAQFMTLSHKNTGMAVTTDLVDNINDIHPINKQDVGYRLALWAFAKDYGKPVVYSGPLYSSMKVEGDKIRIHFSQVGGGLASRGPLAGFAIASYDQKFMPAVATIDGNDVLVSSPQVKVPLAVRFGWTDAPVPNLFNKEGLPASPFRTDSWPAVTDSVKW